MADRPRKPDDNERALLAIAQSFSLEGDSWTCGNLGIVLIARAQGKQRKLSKLMYDFTVAELGGEDELPPEIFID